MSTSIGPFSGNYAGWMLGLRCWLSGTLVLHPPERPILGWLEENGYILVTENRSTIPVHLSDHFAAGQHVPGVFWIRPDVGIGRVIEELYLIWSVSTAEEYRDRALFIPL